MENELYFSNNLVSFETLDLNNINGGDWLLDLYGVGTFIILVGIGCTLPITSTALVALYTAGLLGSQFCAIFGWMV